MIQVSVDNAIQQVAKCSTDEKLDKMSSIQQERCDKFVEPLRNVFKIDSIITRPYSGCRQFILVLKVDCPEMKLALTTKLRSYI